MNRLALVLLACLLSVAGAATALIVGVEQMVDANQSSDFTYTVRLEPSEPLTNVTLLLPIPDPRPAGFGGNLSVNAPMGAQNWSMGAEDTEFGPMLAVQAPVLAPGAEGEGSEITMKWANDGEAIDTRTPAKAGEPLLQPFGNGTRVECGFDHPVEWDENLACQEFTSLVLASYEGSPNATLVVRVDFHAQNTWGAGGALGSGGNSYRQSIHAEVDGSQEAWRETRGTLVTGEGRYRT